MADPRTPFRFRLPWLPVGQPPRPTYAPRPPTQPTATTTPTIRTPQTATTQFPTQPTITVTPTSTTPPTVEPQVPMQPTTTTSIPTTQTAETEPPSQSTIASTPIPTAIPQTAETQSQIQPATANTAPVPADERPPFEPPGLSPSQVPPPQSQTSRTELQPPSPSRATSQPRVPSQPASPARAPTQSRAPSQPSTPPRASPQPRAVSLPSTPPPRRSPQLPSAPRTTTQPRSPSLSSSRLADQTSSPPPSRTAARAQPTTEAVKQPTAPLKGDHTLTNKSSPPSASSTEVISAVSDIQEPKSTVSEAPPLDLQPKAETISGVVYGSEDLAPFEKESQFNETTKQPSKESRSRAAKTFTSTEGPETPALSQESNNSIINPEPESFPKELKPEETKEVKEVMQGTNDKAREARHKDADFPGAQSNTLHTRGQPGIAFQFEETPKTVSRKDLTATSASNGRQTKITSAQPGNKNMVVDNRQKLPISNGEYIPLHKEIRGDISRLVQKMTVGDSKRSIEDRPVSVVTLAGENRGATMHLGSDSSRKEGAVHIHRGYKIKPDESAEATTDGEESFKEKPSNSKTKEDKASEAYVNSNIQGINNSILFNSSITEGNPGVHLIRSKFPTESKKPSGKPELLETRKAEFNMTPSQKLTYEPTVRRRCLRGLFLESSDSDLDSTKPHSHGCRVGCNEKRKTNNIDAL